MAVFKKANGQDIPVEVVASTEVDVAAEVEPTSVVLLRVLPGDIGPVVLR